MALSCDFLRTMCNIVKPPQAPDPRLRGTLRICQGPEGLLLATHIKNTPTDPGWSSILGKITHPCQIIYVSQLLKPTSAQAAITQAPLGPLGLLAAEMFIPGLRIVVLWLLEGFSSDGNDGEHVPPQKWQGDTMIQPTKI